MVFPSIIVIQFDFMLFSVGVPPENIVNVSLKKIRETQYNKVNLKFVCQRGPQNN